MYVNQLKKEIGNKERYINDLIRFITTNNERNPNYCFLLGAGCSVTSGIKSANDLIELWRKELCLSEYADEFDANNFDKDKAIKVLKERGSTWYDLRYEYSSLFEKRYDLPRQRRAFIEQEVADKKPSIGYAYLVNLVKAGYFNTIFTTNFDDLLNEAFYIFSDQRPMTCAHDSAITSITVTSRRPKIIKLHGDYLFDDIKSTMRETESLENNMRNKFIEFSKDFGLIVVGYSGNDRSIMDILFYLLKSEVYFKNGIYWCLRKNDIINPDLRKLLWKDRVYFIETDGFDELLAELNFKINSNKLPVEPILFSNKGEEIIKGFLGNNFLKSSKSTIISADIKRLKEQKTKDFFKDIISSLQLNENDSSNSRPLNKNKLDRKGQRLSNAERIELFQLQEKVLQSKYDDVILEIENIFKNKIDITEKFKVELHKIKAKCYNEKGFSKLAIQAHQEIEAIEGPSVSNYSAQISLTKDINDKLYLINKILKIDPHYYKPYYLKAQIMYSQFADIIDKDKRPDKKDIMSCIDLGIQKYPTIDNPCWDLKFEFIKSEFEENEKIPLCQEIINILKLQDPYDLSLLDKEVTVMTENKIESSIILAYIEEIREKSSIKNKIAYEIYLLDKLSEFNVKDKIKPQLLNIEDNYDINSDYLFMKSKILLQKFDLLKDAIKILEEALSYETTHSILRRLSQYYLYNNQIDEAKDIILHKLGNDNEDELIDLFEAQKDYKSALEIAKKQLNENPLSLDAIIQYSYLLLKTEDYITAFEFCREKLEFSNYTESILIINHELAAIKLKKKIHEERLNRATSEKDNMIKAAVALLKNDKNKCFFYIDQELSKNYERKYEFKDWVLFESIKDDERFIKLYKK